MEENYKNGYFGCKKIQSIGWIFFFFFLKAMNNTYKQEAIGNGQATMTWIKDPQKNDINNKKINKKQMREMGVITWEIVK